MPWWYYDKEELKNTPTMKLHGVDCETEKRYRREATNFIKECGNLMNLGYATMHTAIVYMHRFYMYHSFKTFPRFVTACSCLFLAGKVEETPKKCRDIIRKAEQILSSQKFASFGQDPKEEVITMERILLKTIKFDLQVDHPYRFLIEYAKCLKSNGPPTPKEVVQKAWNFINDSLETTLCLQWEPEIIAVAMLYLACKISKFDVIDWKGRTAEHQRWWDMFVKDMNKTILDDICHQVLDLYQNPPDKIACPDSPPQLPPSKASPPLKRPRFQTQQQPVNNIKVIGQQNHIPVKVSNNEPQEPLAKVPNLPPNTFGYPAPMSYGMIPMPPHNPPMPPMYSQPMHPQAPSHLPPPPGTNYQMNSHKNHHRPPPPHHHQPPSYHHP